MTIYRYVLSEDDYTRLVHGQPVTVNLTDDVSNPDRDRLEMILSDIGFERMLFALRAAQLKAAADAAYEDEGFPVRACDYCGKPYRGPAVYCSFKCAIDDD